VAEQLTFQLPNNHKVTASIRRLLCAGYTGRNRADVELHITELAAIGIDRPSHIPTLFPIMPALLSQSAETYVLGENTAPEVEFVLFRQSEVDYVTVGSDQTDLAMEAKAPSMAKNLCVKSIARAAWPLNDVEKNWDDMEIELICDQKTMQKGRLNLIMTPGALFDFVARHDGPDHEGRMIFSGTLETHGKYPKSKISVELILSDPIRGRQIRHSYTVTPMAELFPRSP
jgi:hypothetical protein